MAILSPDPAPAEPLFAQGLQFHIQGDLGKAMQTYEHVLAQAPRHFEALHHVGIIAFQTGSYAMAAGFLRSALAVAPEAAAAHSNLGNALREMQHLEDALLSYDRALALNGGDADTWYNRGIALQKLQRPADALHSYDQALAINSGDDQAWSNRAATLQHLQRFDVALHSVAQALAANPHNIEAHNICGNILQELGRLDEAAASYLQAAALAPAHPDAHLNLGRLHLSRARFDEALQCFDQAISLAPRWLEAYTQRATVLRQLQRDDEAQRDVATGAALQRDQIDAYRQLGQELQEMNRPLAGARVIAALLQLDDRDAAAWQLHARMLNGAGQRDAALASIARALALVPDSADYYVTRGAILRASLRYDEAQQCYERAVQLAPQHPGGYTNLGSVLDQTGHAERAMACYAQAIALDPDCALAHWNRALVYLRQGDYARGWRDYEWRWKAETLAVYKGKRNFPQPAWRGSEALAGKTILLHAEQGLGDTLQFCRYATLVARRSAVVILEVQQPLAALLATLAGVHQIVIKGDALPSFDYHIPLMSLPLAFGTELATVPSTTPYLSSDAAKVAQWRALLGPQTRPRVGVVWGGHPDNPNDHNRSVPLAVFARLFSDEYEFISLQKEIRPADQALLDTLPVRQPGALLHDFSDTAALCQLMDLVVTVDTSVAHLAGALGKPVWILLQTPFEWRWLEHGAASPWYRCASLYRQAERGAWAPVIDAVAADLVRLRPPNHDAV